jgi:short subunit dehydrogenase-like uncharacterized protein
MASERPQRRLAIIILGATGVTGRQAVPYVRERARELGFAWGIAGRSPDRLRALVAGWPEEERPELFAVDTASPETVAAAVERTDAIVNFAGPFARMAPTVIAAAVEAGIAYVDVTGEIDFAAEMVHRWHHRASETGARIVQVCGFEALPFDLVAAAAVERLDRDHSQQPAAIDSVFAGAGPPGLPRPSDMVSNGTFESLREAMAREDASVLGDPAALIGDLAPATLVRSVSPISNRPRWKEGVGPLAPMIPSPVINPPVIQRSLALAGLPPVRYREGVAVSSLVPTLPLQAFAAATVAGINGGLSLLARAPSGVRRAGTSAMKAFAPAGGPAEDRLAAWTWSIECEARGAQGALSRARVEATGHPGYLATSRMTAEAGLMLADTGAQTPDVAGVLTPAIALGTGELSRFAAADLDFS